MIKEYILVRTKRKSIGLALTPEGELKVYVPHRMPVKVINETLERHKDWIEQRKQKLLAQRVPPKTFTEGEELPFMGKYYKLRFVQNPKEVVTFQDGFMNVDDQFKEDAKDFIIWWYKYQAKMLLVQRTLIHGNQLLLHHRKVKISNAKTRWGSCSSYGSINLNWRLILAPEPVMDLVIIHELIHLNQMDHSQDFHKKMEKIIPDHEKWNKWLAKYGRYLFIDK